MRAEAKALLTKLGLDSETIALLSSDEGEVKVDEIYKSTRDNLAEVFKNDEAFIAPIKASVRGEVLSSKERKLMKQFGVTQEEYEALPQSTKFDSLIELCGSKAKPTGTPDDVKAEIAKLRSTIVEKDERIKKLTEEEIPAIKSTVERERAEVQRQLSLQKTLKQSLGDKKLLVSEEVAFAVLNAELGQKYDIKHVNGELVVYVKGTDREAFDENSRKVTVQSAYAATLEAHKLIQKSNGGQQQQQTTTTTTTKHEEKPGVVVPPGLRTAIEAAEKRKTAAGK